VDPAARFMKIASFGNLVAADCALCGGVNSVVVVRQEVFGENFHVVRCTGCGLMRTNPRPDAAWKERFYDSKYNGYMESQSRDFVYAPDPSRLMGYNRLLDFLTMRTNPKSSLLDVGCAAGLFVKEASNRGFRATGCDYSETAIAYGKNHFGVSIIRSVAEEIDSPDDQYDVVTILHVIEHLPEPLKVLRELRRVLKPGGLVLIETVNYSAHAKIEKHLKFLIPVYGSLTHRQGLPWVPFDHLYHWSPETLMAAMEMAGFKMVESHLLSGYRSEMKPNRGFSLIYGICEMIGRALVAVSRRKWQFWPVLLATGRK